MGNVNGENGDVGSGQEEEIEKGDGGKMGNGNFGSHCFLVLEIVKVESDESEFRS